MKRTKRGGSSLWLTNFLQSVVAIVLSMLVSSLLMLAVGYNPIAAYGALFQGAFGSVNAVANTLSKSIPLLFTGLAFAFASKGGMFNIGGEGQLYMGALASTSVALLLRGAPSFVALPLAILAGMVAGGIMGALVGIVKAKLHLNEVIVAIMLNYIASLFASYLISGSLKAVDSMTPQSEVLPDAFLFQKLVPKTQLTTALLLALVLAALLFFFFKKSRAGFNIRAVGENPLAAQVSGVDMTMVMVLTMAASGAIAALAGITEVFGKYGRYIDGFSPGFGFTGIAVSVLGGNNPFGIVLTAILFGALDAGALKMSYTAGISANMVMVIQALVILFVATPKLVGGLFRKGGKLRGKS